MKNGNADIGVLFVLSGLVAAVVIVAFLVAWQKRSGAQSGAGETVDNDENDQDGNSVDDSNGSNAVIGAIAGALGGIANIYSLRSSDTRLRVTVNDGALVDKRRLKATGALGILAKGRQVQVFYEEQVDRICRELAGYIDGYRKNNVDQEVELDYERVLKKVYVPVEGDVVCVSDIHCLQNVGDGSIGVCAIRAARGEIRAPFDCKAGYSKNGEGQIECVSEDGYMVRMYLISESDTGWQRVVSSVAISLNCDDGERVRKGSLLADYPYETLAGRGEMVYAVLEMHAGENKEVDLPDAANSRYRLKINKREKVNYEYAACELVV